MKTLAKSLAIAALGLFVLAGIATIVSTCAAGRIHPQPQLQSQ